MHALSRVLDERLRYTNDTLIKHLTDVVAGVSEVKETNRQIFTLADQLKNLERVLTHQKHRGSLGEESLKLCLENMLPPTAFRLQHGFSDGSIVDAVIMTKEGMVPIDSKFPLENYNRITLEDNDEKRQVLEKEFIGDLKRRIDETAKYIKPQEGTLPFAFMFLPAEGIYYDLLVNEVGTLKVNTRNLIEYASNDKHVIIVSPTTFAAYLQSVVYGFRAFKIEESAKEIRKNVEALSKHLRSYDEYFKKVGNSLGTTVNQYNLARKELGKIDKDVTRITGESIELEDVTLEGPIKGEG
jgi:DNA recombination protein RmuC